MMDSVKVTFENGDSFETDFNAEVSREEIKKYYLGKYFNLGSVDDNMQKCINVEFRDEKEVLQ